MIESYKQFIASKVATVDQFGFEVDRSEVNPALKPHTRDIVQWAVRGGRRAIFASFGLHKTATQIEIMRLIGLKVPCLRLITMPLGVRQEFKRETADGFTGEYAAPLKFIRSASEIEDERTIYLTNYESVRDGKLDASLFKAVSLDEAAILRGLGGTKTFRQFMKLFEGTSTYRFVATATPSPNEYIELLSYAAFLDIMQVSEAKTRFFKRDVVKADNLTLHPHKEEEFWMWVASWAIFLQRPSDLGYSDEGYELPALDIRWHEVPSDHSDAGHERDGQVRLLKNTTVGVVGAAGDGCEARADRLGVRAGGGLLGGFDLLRPAGGGGAGGAELVCNDRGG